MNFKLLSPATGPDLQHTNEMIRDFLHEHLGKYGDSKGAIEKCLNYALGISDPRGGNILLALNDDEIAGIVVTNQTGMKGYIPENVLVYIAVNSAFRGQGIGGKLLQHIKKVTKGDIALHVEPDNPAVRLYERVGFENPYLEMRWKRD